MLTFSTDVNHSLIWTTIWVTILKKEKQTK